MSDVLLDTCVVIAHLRRRTNALQHVEKGGMAFITNTVLGELWHGICKSGRPENAVADLGNFLEHVGVLQSDGRTAEIYGEIASGLERAGRRIPTNDIWIAAIALECGLPIATQDPHFLRVDGLEVLLWK